MSTMTYESLERSNSNHKASTFGLWPGVAGVQIEKIADIFCPSCAKDILGQELFNRLKKDDLGYNHPKSDELGNVTVVLSDSEFDCPGGYCGHCGIELDVSIIHYDAVCGQHCPNN